jgi:hypothetical protein
MWKMKRRPPKKREVAPRIVAAEGSLAEPLPGWAPAVLVGGATLIMLAWTWGRWPDLLIDFSRDLYTATQLAHGRVLYRDIAFFTGPLSPYLNACWLRIFGTSLHALVALNLIVLGGFLWLLYRVLREIGSRLAATVSCLVFVTTFALAHLVPMGNYNFICPYSHDMVHGFVLGIGAIYALALYTRSLSTRTAWAAGIQLGLVQLTRAEISLPVLLACICGLVAMMIRDPRVRSLRSSLILRVVAPATAIPLLVFLLMGSFMPWARAFWGVLGSWVWVFDPVVGAMAIYRESMGLDDLSGNFGRILAWAAIYAGVLLPPLLFALRTRSDHRGRGAVLVLLAGLAAVIMAVGWRHTGPADLARPLPLVAAVLGAMTIFALAKDSGGEPARASLTVRLMFSALAFSLLGKMLLNARFFHYGFILAVPATMLAVLGLVDWIPGWIAKRGGSGAAFRWASVALLAGLVAIFLQLSATCLARKTTPVGEGGNAFVADSRGEQVNAVVGFLAREVPGDMSLAVVPEGSMINILSGRTNPVYCTNLMPPELATLGENNVLGDLERTPPDVLVVDLDRIGPQGLGFRKEIYASRIAAWILAHYELVARFESPPTHPMRIRLGVMRYQGGASSAVDPASPS